MRLEVSHHGVPLGHTDLATEGLAIGEFTPTDSYAGVRDVIRDASRSLWAMGLFPTEKAPPHRIAVEDLAAAARLQFELRDARGALVHSDFVNIVEPPDPGSFPMIIARFQLSHDGIPSPRQPQHRDDGAAPRTPNEES